MRYFIGLDIGGTKCAASLGALEAGGSIELLGKRQFPTQGTPASMLEKLGDAICELKGDRAVEAIGVSCGGPLDSRRGIILSPPNLPGWDNVPVREIMEKRFGIPCYLQNDADACALAEWKFGAGRGTSNMVFLTCGTGFGAGLILDGRLYSGSCDMAGEIGHIRVAAQGPVGYGKAGSFEGFCSGGGIAQVARMRALEQLQQGKETAFCHSYEELPGLTAKQVAEAANGGDPLAEGIYRECGAYLGQALALLVDLLNPQAIVLGSIYARCENLLREACREVIERECLPRAARECQILPAKLEEELGDIAALAVAIREEK